MPKLTNLYTSNKEYMKLNYNETEIDATSNYYESLAGIISLETYPL